MRLSELQLRLQDLDCKPCHVERLLRGWVQRRSYDRKGSPAATFFPAALRAALPAIEAELQGLARLKSAHPDTLPLSAREQELRRDSEVARLLVELHDGQLTESVLLPRGGLCISTQVGCAVGCVFCMSGRAGLVRQLDSAEIVAQVVLARSLRAVSKVVFMGMGEPAHNLDNVLEAIEVLGMQGNIAHKNLVLSTVGDLRVFERLMDGLKHGSPPPCRGRAGEGVEAAAHHDSPPNQTFPLHGGRDETTESRGLLNRHANSMNPFVLSLSKYERINGLRQAQAERSDYSISAGSIVKPALALSLHSTDDALRAQLLPKAPRIPVAELVAQCEAYARATHYPTQYQWTLIEGVNDSDAELERLIELLTGKYAIMNFIPFNAVDGLPYRRPAPKRLARIVGTLKQHGIVTQLRDSAGQEVEGACGQLRARAVQARDRTSS